MTHSETYKDCIIQCETNDGVETVTWTDTFGTARRTDLWSDAKHQIDMFVRLVEHKWIGGCSVQ